MNLQEASDAMKLITKIRNSGITILLVEHQMQSLMNISDFVTVLNHGKKIVEGTPKEIQNNKEVIEAYLGKGM
jgi:branched-chain amino acid transport system ATP-binding protein